MYNRYIPQPDGSFRRNQMPDAASNAPAPRREERRSPEPSLEETSPQAECREEPSRPKESSRPRMSPTHANRPSPPTRQKRPSQQPERKDFGVGTFLRQLLPRDFDTEDLLIVLLLLLMSGDCAEDQNTALLTLALYLFM